MTKFLSDAFDVWLVTVIFSVFVWLFVLLVILSSNLFRQKMDSKFKSTSRSFTDDRPIRLQQLAYIVLVPIFNVVVSIFVLLYAFTNYKDGIE